MSVRANISIASLGRLVAARARASDRRAARAAPGDAPPPSAPASTPRALSRTIRTLSGGNQQKSLLARWLMRGCELLSARADARCGRRREGRDLPPARGPGARRRGGARRLDRPARDPRAVRPGAGALEGPRAGRARSRARPPSRICCWPCRAVPRASSAACSRWPADGRRRPRGQALRAATGVGDRVRPLAETLRHRAGRADPALAFWQTSDVFLQTANVRNILIQISVVGVAAIGETIVMLVGGLDLSVGANVLLGSVIIADLVQRQQRRCSLRSSPGSRPRRASALLNGVLTAVIGIEPILATLGTLLLAGGDREGAPEQLLDHRRRPVLRRPRPARRLLSTADHGRGDARAVRDRRRRDARDALRTRASTRSAATPGRRASPGCRRCGCGSSRSRSAGLFAGIAGLLQIGAARDRQQGNAAGTRVPARSRRR